MKYDFGGYATRNNLECADGRVIRRDAFKAQDGMKVPLVWQHQRNDPENVIGHAYLENRNDGVYAYCSLNNSRKARQTREIIEHGDVDALSIYANKLIQTGNSVTHGMIREVSVVISGANPGAVIDNPVVQHSDDDEGYVDMTRAIMAFDSPIDILQHSDDDEDDEDEKVKKPSKKKPVKMEDDDDEDDENDEEAEDDEDDEPPKKKSSQSMSHASDSEDDGEETVQDVYNTFTEKQKKVVAYIVGAALAEQADEEEDAEHSAMEGDDHNMKKNVFDGQDQVIPEESLTHDQFTAIMDDAKKCGSLKESFLKHAATYGIENIDILFPDAQAVAKEPYLIKRDTAWVQGVLSETTHVPFSRVKSTCADLTADEARARGYVKGNLKKDEVIRLLKRITTPTTIYKKQKLDRDDVIEITDLNVIAWLKAEMRIMLNEELARAVLIGDGREADSDDKINEENIRPIWKDDDMYSHHVEIANDATADEVVEEVIRARKFYKGTGTPTFYTTTDTLTEMLLVKDKIGRRIYTTEAELASALRVSKIVEVPVMDNQTREVNDKNLTLLGLIVNLRDYTIGSTQGGQVSMFDDFDIDYNQYKYLIETRCSGALTMPKSALVLERVGVDETPSKPSKPDEDENDSELG